MPNAILDRIPFPNLKVYTSVSVLLVSCCIFYAINSTNNTFWRLYTNSSVSSSTHSNAAQSVYFSVISDDIKNAIVDENHLNAALLTKDPQDTTTTTTVAIGDSSDDAEQGIQDEKFKQQQQQHQQQNQQIYGQFQSNQKRIFNDTRTISTKFKDVVAFILQEPICIWTVINMGYCCLILLWKMIQNIVFGDLRISEQQHLKDKFWNFIFYKFIFIFGVVNVQFLHEVVLWVSWFSILGFLHLLSQLCKERFEYFTFSPTTPGWCHFRLVALLSAILTLSGIMFVICIGFGFFGGLSTFAFMSAECIMLNIRTSHVLISYGMYLYEMRQGNITSEATTWDKRGILTYYLEFAFEASALIVDLLHHIHMLIWSNILLSMASLVIVMQLRYLIHEIQKKIKKHRNYLWVLSHMEKTYPLATSDDLNQNSENCAICWEKMETARKLPCSHLFHNLCLQSWLEQDTSCPTCRLDLKIKNNTNMQTRIEQIVDEQENNPRRTNNHFFHFNGSRYISWLPNFSVEVTHINNVLRGDQLLEDNPTPNPTSQIRTLARQIQIMFPRYPLSIIIADLNASRSMEVTIDNILNGQLVLPGGGRVDFDDDEFAVNPPPANTRGFYSDDTVTGGTSSPANTLESSSAANVNQLSDDSTSQENTCDKFLKSSSEREKHLQRRKEGLLAAARKRYMDTNSSDYNFKVSTSENDGKRTMALAEN